jgi:hypothetical protein
MADGFSASIITRPVTDAITAKQVRSQRATMYALRQTGRVCSAAAKAATPVYKGPGLTQKAYKTDRRGSGINTPVRGLLRSSIKPTRKITDAGGAMYLRVAPRGLRVRLYRGKIAAQVPYMEEGRKAAIAAAPAIWNSAIAKVWR